MRNIEQILSGIEGLTDDQRKAIVDGVNENYRSKAEAESKAERISTLEAEIEGYKSKIEKLESDNSEVSALKQQLADFEAAEEKRKADAEEAERHASFEKVFDEAVKSREAKVGNAFANPFMHDGILSRVRDLCEENPAVSVKDAIDSVTKDVPGVWMNPQQAPAIMPSDVGGEKSKEDAAKQTIRRFMAGLTSE